jgi:hypothetical protein
MLTLKHVGSSDDAEQAFPTGLEFARQPLGNAITATPLPQLMAVAMTGSIRSSAGASSGTRSQVSAGETMEGQGSRVRQDETTAPSPLAMDVSLCLHIGFSTDGWCHPAFPWCHRPDNPLISLIVDGTDLQASVLPPSDAARRRERAR